MSSSPMPRGTAGVAGPGLSSSPPVPSAGPGRRGPVVGGSRWGNPRFLPDRAGPARPGVCVIKGLPGRVGTGSGEKGWLEPVELPGSSAVLRAAPAGVLGED